jgi:hypothetical protein
MHKIILPVVVVAIFLFGFFITRSTLSKIYSDIQGQIKSVGVGQVVKEKSGCDENCQKEIANQVARAVATLSATPQKVVTTTNVPAAASRPQDSYIQISGLGSTQNTSWTDVVGTDFSFDVTRDFEKGANFAWEGFLKVTDANGTAFARIYDVTHSIGVDGSEISIVNKADFSRANSINMNFWSGRNIYRVQIKSLNGFKVDYMGGKIRISY